MQEENKRDLRYLKQIIAIIFISILTYILIVYDEVANILAGVAILLIGMMNLSGGFKTFSGGLLEKILAKSTNTTPKSVIFGTISTIIMQSSSLVSIITISFLSAGLISLLQGIGIIFGANLGNSAGSWLIVGITSIKISTFAIPMLIIGVLLFFQKDVIFKGIGQILIGIGFFFLGVDYIKSGFEEVKEIFNLSRFNVEGMKGVLVFTALGAILTGVIQSSHATLAIIISALLSNQISYENALAATLGTSVGGVVTALLASLSTNIEGKKLALANCIFNFGIALIVLVIFPYFVIMVDFIAKFIGISPDNFALKTAVFHTLFNLIAVILFSLFIKNIVHFLDKYIKAAKDKNKDKALYLDPNLTRYPDTAIEALRKESEHLYNNTYAIIAHTIGFNRRDIRSNLSFSEIIKTKKWFKQNVDLDYLYQTRIKVLFEAIMEFSAKAQLHIKDEEKNERIFAFKIAAKNLTEATKNLKIIQANIKRNSASKNENLANEYNTIRKNLGELLRSVEELRLVEDEKAYLIIKNFAKAKEILKEIDNEALKKIETLLAENKITTAEGISILNDTAFIAKIAEEIIEAVEIIFAKEDIKKKEDEKQETI
ncbi:Na/Pi cotransporter family protein [Campylobacter helveticus]|uniref:Na/Pi cotransporter family protein n=1 Tax=Campylobacter helveticus TaxID=28898 RepID=A0AAX2ULA6_9BACT|nr:Na/Pi symporter [Campylobacter helveticus]ARE81138.1 Na+/Pi-cotransporter [Campylobacter helveticus]MCR2054795.1 Na/Pi symporter [Campylobacter helveticus]TNB57966.1 Na/Pi cotransporter family protein [Campylobacter helveticus]TNB60381.1 Na/Pi cotransporter family protein [Campylobacter helveticus]TNH35997.1 Na/Pi cotransporter family protein [Campylobacter helveticus]